MARRALKRPALKRPAQTPKPRVSVSEPELLNAQGDKRRKVLILYTGGTVGMVKGADGSLRPQPGALLKRLKQMEELSQDSVPQCFMEEFDPILDSADMCPEDWCTIARCIQRHYYDFEGFVVLHGTDTMAYTASALSFMLEQLDKPVVLTGSQLPIAEPLTDAKSNFLGALCFAGKVELTEVCVFFSSKLYRGNRCKKVDASAMTAFDSPNFSELAVVGTEVKINSSLLCNPPKGRFRVHLISEKEIFVIQVVPGFADSIFECLSSSGSVRGVVLLLYGCGNAPSRKSAFLEACGKMNEAGIIVVACSQCPRGSVDIDKYAVGRAFAERGVISVFDMTAEATVTKLSYLLSKGLPPADCRKAMKENLRGEITLSPDLPSSWSL